MADPVALLVGRDQLGPVPVPAVQFALDDLDRAAALLAAWARRLKSDTSFIPF